MLCVCQCLQGHCLHLSTSFAAFGCTRIASGFFLSLSLQTRNGIYDMRMNPLLPLAMAAELTDEGSGVLARQRLV